MDDIFRLEDRRECVEVRVRHGGAMPVFVLMVQNG
jgi:hypothetical protein